MDASHPDRALDPDRLVDTADRLQRRIVERFPGSGLGRLALELGEAARRTAVTARGLAAPVWWLRALTWVCTAATAAAFLGTFLFLRGRVELYSSVAEFFQGLTALIDEVVFFGIALVFLFTLEGRVKRARALRSLYGLRALAHIVDMHQLTKDPERTSGAGGRTASSPERTLTPFELTRYLDYCTEMLAIVSKLAALHVQHLNDPVTLSAVNDVEELTQGLSRTIWQKIMILDRIAGAEAGPRGGAGA